MYSVLSILMKAIATDVELILNDILRIPGGVQPDTALLNSPYFDSMAAVAVLTALEEHFAVQINDDEVSAELFETVNTLSHFVAGKVGDAAR